MTADTTDSQVPPPVVDLDIDGVFHLPPSKDAIDDAVPFVTIVAALILHALVAALLLTNWKPPALPPIKSLQVTLLRDVPKAPEPLKPVEKKPEPPKPKLELPKPEPPKPKLELPKPEPPKPEAEEAPKPPPPPPPPKAAEKPKPPPEPPKPAEMKPRESGPDDKTEAAKRETPPNKELPPPLPVEPKAEEVKPPPDPEVAIPDPKPTPPATKRPTARGHGQMVPLDALPPALQSQRQTAPPIRNLVLRLPSHGSGSGERDFAGDSYLNKLKNLLEANRIYPPAEAFADLHSRVTVFSVVIEPSGRIVTITRDFGTEVPAIDEAARQMIDNVNPFPAVPADYPRQRTLITIFIPMFPR